MQKPNQIDCSTVVAKKTQKGGSTTFRSRNPRNVVASQDEISLKGSSVSRMNPTLTPKAKVDMYLSRAGSQSTRSNSTISLFERDNSQTKHQNHLDGDSTISSNDEGKLLYQATTERKRLEQYYKQMENRVKHLKDEDQRMKSKIQQTVKKTRQMVEAKTRHLEELSFNAQRHELKEQERIKKKQQICEIRAKSRENLERSENRHRKAIESRALEVRREKSLNKSLIIEMREEEEIKNSEKIWKIACHEKKVENNKLLARLKKRNEIKKRFNEKLLQEKTKAEEINNRIRDLEDLEIQLLENMQVTQATHMNAFQEMVSVHSSDNSSTRPLKSHRLK